MANPLLKIAVRWFGSKVPTSLMHLDDIREVTVLLDADANDAPQAEAAIRDYFAAKGILLTLVGVHAKKPVRASRNTQAIISLVPWNSFRMEYVLNRSSARFKAGRRQLSGEVLDLVVSDPEGRPYPQTEVFARMMELVEGLG